MIVFPNAKINLGLQITERLKDGYHHINSCLYPIPLTDALEFVPAKSKTTFNSSGIGIPKDGKDNLVLRAYKLLKKDFQLPHLSIHLHKHIPTGAGLGGGSADAAFMLSTLNDYFQLFLDDSILEEYASQLGSDCPFFIQNKPCLVQGTGVELETIDVDLEGMHMILVKPDFHISTQKAYQGVEPKPPEEDIKALLASKDFELWRRKLKNDFESSVFDEYPELRQIKDTLYDFGAVYASMSGSGSTIFGLFQNEPQEISALREKYFYQRLSL